jgi:hypothetical protein
MFAYNPQVTDRSGEFLAAGRLGAAQSNAQMLEQLGEDIGGTIRSAGSAAAGFAMGGPAGAAMAMRGGGGEGRGGGAPSSVLDSIFSAYAENQQVKNDAKIYGELLKFAGPAIGDTKGEVLNSYKQMDEREQAAFGRTLFGGGMFATLSQGYNFGRGVDQRAGQPFINQQLDDLTNTASGNRTVTPGSPMPAGADDPANTVPLPEADAPLPAVQGAPGAAPSVPGGRASWDARNRDRQKRGLQPLPYPPGL